MSTIETIRIDDITASIQVRKITAAGVDRLASRIRERGYQERYPVAVARIADGYKLLDGNHRLEAAKRLGSDAILAQVFDGLTPEDEYRIAFESNESQSTLVPMDWTDHAEFIWSLTAAGRSQTDVAGILGWGRGQVNLYQMMRNIDGGAWGLVVDTTKKANVSSGDGDDVSGHDTNVSTRIFTEGILRSIVALDAADQLSLVKDLAAGRDGRWTRACSHDFKLRVGCQIARFDVMGPRQRDHSFGLNEGKKPTDYHLFADMDGERILWLGYLPGHKMARIVCPERFISPIKLIVRLNSCKHGISWSGPGFPGHRIDKATR